MCRVNVGRDEILRRKPLTITSIDIITTQLREKHWHAKSQRISAFVILKLIILILGSSACCLSPCLHRRLIKIFPTNSLANFYHYILSFKYPFVEIRFDLRKRKAFAS